MKRNVLVIGASSDLASEIILDLTKNYDKVGLHYSGNLQAIQKYESYSNVRIFQKNIKNEDDCKDIINSYIEWAATIDCLVVLMGDITCVEHWKNINIDSMQRDYLVNAVYPFLLARYASDFMTKKQGKIIFVSTASAKRGGGSSTLGYGMAKYALECAAKRLAKDLAIENIAVNVIAPGFFDTKFQTEKAKKTVDELEKRAKFVPLKRAGTKKEFASLVLYLLSDEAGFITGQIISIDGGDFV